MADIPLADGPYAQNTVYGATKATALEIARLSLMQETNTWISGVSECRAKIWNGHWQVILRFISSAGFRYTSTVILVQRNQVDRFPIASASLAFQDDVIKSSTWAVSASGNITRQE